jgi:hypothetical protein
MTVVDLNELECKIYVDAELPPSGLAKLLAESLPGATVSPTMTRTVCTPLGEIEVRTNKESDKVQARDFPDGFLYFGSALEVYPFPTLPRQARVDWVASLLSLLWSKGIPAVAACDYESELPNAGGYNTSSVPWPSSGGGPDGQLESSGALQPREMRQRSGG